MSAPVTLRCAALTANGCGANCIRRASVVVADVPYCGQHAKAALREAEEAARDAARWERMFTPTPHQPWRGNPDWQSLKRELFSLGKDPGLNADERMLRSISLVMRIAEIEARYE